jgi:hypothetical protein
LVGARLFQLFVATGMKVGDKVVYLGFLQDVCEGWHLLTALKYLYAYPGFAQQAAYPGEVRPLGSTIAVDCVAVLATVVGEDRRSPTFGRSRGECRNRRCECKGKDKGRTQ